MGACLVVGGESQEPSGTAELVDPYSGSSLLKYTTATRRAHTATLLPIRQSVGVSSEPARVLIAGGGDNGFIASPQSSAEIYDAGAGSFSPTAGTMSAARHTHAAALLENGTVLIVGGLGLNGQLESSADLYDDVSRTFSAIGNMTTPRWGHTATTLTDGRVLITGGEHLRKGPLASAEVYDPATGMFTSIGNMNRARWQHSATLLKNGKVLLVGGFYENTAEVFDPTTGTFTATGSMEAVYERHGAVLLDDGRVLIVGSSSGPGRIRDGEVYDPVTGTFQATTGGSLGQRAARIDDNRVYTFGDPSDPRGYLFDPRTNGWTPLPNLLVYARTGPYCTVTYLPSPRVIYYAQIDPLALLLSERVYLDLHAPDPPPPGVLEARIRAAIAGLDLAQRQQLRQRVRAFGLVAEQIERELGNP